MLEILITFAVSICWAVLLLAATNLYLILAANASPTMIPTVRLVRARARNARGKMLVFHCRKGVVYATGYDVASDTEVDQAIYRSRYPFVSLLRWKGGTRSVDFFIRRATMDIALRVVLSVVVLVPAFAVVTWLAVTVHWTWWYLLSAMIAHLIVVGTTKRLVYFKSIGLFTALVAVLVLHRGRWVELPWTVGVSLIGVWVLVSFGLSWWVAQDD